MISIHSLRVEGDSVKYALSISISISIHSLRVEGDKAEQHEYMLTGISIHSLRVEGDSLRCNTTHRGKVFQSTPSVWRETAGCLPRRRRHNHFNPLPPCGGRLVRTLRRLLQARFQSTPSVWRETGDEVTRDAGKRDFNPLPPCGGRRCKWWGEWNRMHFNPLPPCGGRRKRSKNYVQGLQFQSTPSVWRETPHRRRLGLCRRDFNPLPPCGGRLGI